MGTMAAFIIVAFRDFNITSMAHEHILLIFFPFQRLELRDILSKIGLGQWFFSDDYTGMHAVRIKSTARGL